jgi:superfamily II DNA or RNA helicase
MKFVIHNTSTLCEDFSEAEMKLISGWCLKEYEYYGIDYKKKGPRRRQKMTATLHYLEQGPRFPTGWVGSFTERLLKFGHSVEISDQRRKTKDSLSLPYRGFPLRDYQEEAVIEALKRNRGIIHHATGAGKTVILGKILSEIGQPALIIVPTRELLRQTVKKMGEYLDPSLVGWIGDSQFKPNFITVAIVNSVWSHIKAGSEELKKVTDKVEVVVVDEAHHITFAGKNKIKNSYFKIMQLLDVQYRYGLTATPGEEGSIVRELLEGATGRVIHHIGASELIRRGLLSQPTVDMYKISIPHRISDWQSAYKQNILNNEYRNNLIVELANKYAKQGLSVLISAIRVSGHAYPLWQSFDIAGYMVGSTPSNVRESVLDDFSSKRVPILVSTVVNEGVDIPSMDVIIMAGGGKSDKLTVQKVGRALRVSEGKTGCRIIDFYDDDNGILVKQSRARRRVYKNEEEFIVTPYKAPEVEDIVL